MQFKIGILFDSGQILKRRIQQKVDLTGQQGGHPRGRVGNGRVDDLFDLVRVRLGIPPLGVFDQNGLDVRLADLEDQPGGRVSDFRYGRPFS